MRKTDAPLAELVALTAHIKTMHEEMAERGFTMAGDTRIRLQSADTLAAQVDNIDPDSPDATIWVEQAESLSVLLRSEILPMGS